MLGDRLAHDGPRPDAAAVVAYAGDEALLGAMEARQMVERHGDLSVPAILEALRAEMREQPRDDPPRPRLMEAAATVRQPADGADNQSAGRIEAETVHDLSRIPCAKTARQDRRPRVVAKRFGGELEIVERHEFLLETRHEIIRVGIGGDDDPSGPDRAARCLDGPARPFAAKAQ